jgi:Ca2+-binding EF-hand superfamily protein
LGLEEKDIDFYKEIFDLLDSKGKGYISPNDLKSAMKLFGFEP